MFHDGEEEFLDQLIDSPTVYSPKSNEQREDHLKHPMQDKWVDIIWLLSFASFELGRSPRKPQHWVASWPFLKPDSFN
jgi:hypothetical protein